MAPAVLMPNAQVPAAPPPLDRDALLAWLQQQGGAAEARAQAAGEGLEQDAVAPVLDTIVLGPAMPVITDRAQLVLTSPRSVHPETTIEFAADSPGMASVRLKLRAGETYLLDFAVSGLGPGVYALAADSSRREFDDARGDLRHVLIGVKAKLDGWTSVRLQRSGAGYHLHSVAITRAM
jgi:hypothetical protein